MPLSKERRIFLYAFIMGTVISALTFAVMFSDSPLTLSLIDQSRPVIVAGGTEITSADLGLIFTVLFGAYGGSYVFALAFIRK
jgi:hypothetical protein